MKIAVQGFDSQQLENFVTIFSLPSSNSLQRILPFFSHNQTVIPLTKTFIINKQIKQSEIKQILHKHKRSNVFPHLCSGF